MKLNLENLLFSKGFLELKYKTKKIEALKKIKEKFDDNKLDFLRVDELVDVNKIKTFVEEKKGDFENIVILGIGGSALGTRAIMQALKGKYYNELSRKKRGDNLRLYILDNIDPVEIDNLIQNIDLKETLFVVISKSGGTIETISLFNFFKNKIKEKKLNIQKHFVIIAGENSNFKKRSLKEGFDVFDIPETIGGRFSVFTNVGLLPLAFIGIDIDTILNSVKKYRKKVFSNDLNENVALLSSMINYHSYVELGKNILVLFPYSTNLFYFGEWYKQLLAESLGKGGLGITPNTAIGVTDQHSQLQLYYDGPNDKIINFIEVEYLGVDYNISDKITFKELLNIEKYGTEKSITDYNKINYTLSIEKLDEKNLAELILMYEAQIAIMAEFLGVNAFDQPGVEIGKKISKQKIEDNIGKLDFIDNSNTKNITFIGGGNGQSSILKLFKEYTKKIEKTNPIKYNISSIVAMSDDGRTTGMLMKSFEEELDTHLPPPGDLRRILFTLSKSKNKDFFKLLFERVIKIDKSINSFNVLELFNIVIKETLEENTVVDLKKDLQNFREKKGDIYNLINKYNFKNVFLPLQTSIKGHKFGNILMASLFYDFGKDYEKMLLIIKEILEVKDEVLPITIEKASIKALLENGEVIETQDNISNNIDYDSAIKKISFLNNEVPKITNNIKKSIKESDYIIIGPGDLFTSIIANFIVEGLKEEIENSDAKIIYILNANNKKGETTDYKIEDFVNIINGNLGKRNIDYLIGNNKIPELSKKEKAKFKNNISVKGGEYLILSDLYINKLIQKYKNIKIISGEYINPKDLYKYNENLIKDLIWIIK